MLSYIDSDDSDSCSFARDVSRREQENGICEKIELSLFTRDDLDFSLTERDGEVSVTYLLIKMSRGLSFLESYEGLQIWSQF